MKKIILVSLYFFLACQQHTEHSKKLNVKNTEPKSEIEVLRKIWKNLWLNDRREIKGNGAFFILNELLNEKDYLTTNLKLDTFLRNNPKSFFEGSSKEKIIGLVHKINLDFKEILENQRNETSLIKSIENDLKKLVSEVEKVKAQEEEEELEIQPNGNGLKQIIINSLEAAIKQLEEI